MGSLWMSGATCAMQLRSILRLLLTPAAMLVASSCGGGSDSIYDGARGVGSGVLAGEVVPVTESVGIFVWGESGNQLCHQWSVARNSESGWFYGTNYPWSSADVYVLAAPQDPLSVIAAENFEFTKGSVEAFEGDTVFFRGRNGFFGAWAIEAIEGREGAVLSGTWYFRAGGGGNFTSAIEPGGLSNYDPDVGVCDGY